MKQSASTILTHSPDGVTVISTDKEHGHVPRGCHAQRRVEVSLARRPVAEVADGDVFLAR